MEPWLLALGGFGIVATGGWSLAIYFMRLVYRGNLVPSDDRDQWRAESRIKDQQIHELTDQNSAMLKAFGPTLTDFLQGLRRAATLHDDSEVP